MRRLHPALTIMLAAALLWLADGLRTAGHARFHAWERYEDVYYLPPSGALRWISLGWDEAAADLIWMRGLVYFGDEVIHQGRVRFVYDYADAMVTLDPRFRSAYRWVGVAGIYRPVAVPIEEMERAVAFMERGARVFPEDGELLWDIGAILTYEIAPYLEGERHDETIERGAHYMMAAARLGEAPPWAVLSNAAVLARVGRDEQAARHLEEMYLNVEDESMRARIAERIHQLRSRAASEAFLGAMREFDEARVRDFPYLSPEMYQLVGPRPPIDVDVPLRGGFAPTFAEESLTLGSQPEE